METMTLLPRLKQRIPFLSWTEFSWDNGTQKTKIRPFQLNRDNWQS